MRTNRIKDALERERAVNLRYAEVIEKQHARIVELESMLATAKLNAETGHARANMAEKERDEARKATREAGEGTT